MKLHDKLGGEGVHFLQCLHWTLANTYHSTWHSCFGLSAEPYGRAREKRRNLKYGIGIAAYGKLTLKEKNKLPGHISTTMFDNLAKGLGDLRVKHLDEILDPKYAKYYEDPELARR